jgi:hypothetical protein
MFQVNILYLLENMYYYLLKSHLYETTKRT